MRSTAVVAVVLAIIMSLGVVFFVRGRPADSGLESGNAAVAESSIKNSVESSAGTSIKASDQASTETITETLTETSRSGPTEDMHKEETYFDNILSGGVPQDGIPPIEDPQYMSMKEADQWLNDSDRVFVLESNDGVFVYPQRVLVWHEIVNENIDGRALSITYCPLTGSCIGYYGPDGTTFGTSGRLLNSNLVMYDRETETLWSQILGQEVKDSGIGDTLSVMPIHWTTWGKVKIAFEEASILTDETGFFRDYDRDPYGSYVNEDSYYYNGFVMFPTMGDDDRIPAKKVVVGVKGPQGVLAIDPDYVQKNQPVYTEAGGQPIVAIYDEVLETVRIFKREASERPVSFEGLSKAEYFDVMWFAWVAFYPETEVLR